MATAPDAAPPPTGSPVSGLVVADLHASPPGVDEDVVRGVTLRVEPGEWVAITGPNGGGKTTLAMVLAGLWPARSGRVEFDGRPVSAGMRDRAGIGVLFQDPSTQILQSLAHDELRFAARNLGRDEGWIRAEEERWIESLDLAGDLDRNPRVLSAGRQQTLLFASVMLPGLRLLVADEACAHLDPESRERLLGMVEAERRRGLAVAWVTQAGEEIERATRTIRLNDDRFANRPSIVPVRSAPRDASGDRPEEFRVRISNSVSPSGPRVLVQNETEFRFAARGLTLLTGPNGSGKSVLLEILAGLRTLPGVEVTGLDADTRRPILASQYPEEQIFQERVGDELCYAARQRGASAAETEAAISQAFSALGRSADTWLERQVWSLSGGEKRWVSVVAALISPAQLVLLDEPTAGLDHHLSSVVRNAIVERSESAAVIVATQDQNWVAEMPEAVLRLGRSVAASPSKKTD